MLFKLVKAEAKTVGMFTSIVGICESESIIVKEIACQQDTAIYPKQKLLVYIRRL